MATIFEKIIKGEIPSYRVYEDEKFYAFLDVNPLESGHTLVVTKEPHAYLFDLNDQLYLDLLLTAKKIAVHLKEQLKCSRVCMAVIGWEVQHVHIHLIPTNKIEDFPLSGPNKKPAQKDDLQKICEIVRL